MYAKEPGFYFQLKTYKKIILILLVKVILTGQKNNNHVKSKLKNPSLVETDHLVQWMSALQCFILSR